MQSNAAAFFLQMAVILIACRFIGWLGKKIGQPQVVGEMIAGVLLGPSLLGHFFPEMSAALFTQKTREILYVGGQLGVGLYMFLVGMEFRTDLFRQRARSAAWVSGAGMIVPFMLGGLLAPWLVTVPGLFAEGTQIIHAGMFLGAAIAITAFPMLARIIRERGLSGTSLGTLALAAGAIDDVAAWCVLAIVLASFGGHTGGAVVAIGGGIAYASIMLGPGRYFLRKISRWAEETNGDAALACVLMLFCLGAWFTDAIGIHAVFGGFVLGIAMPKGKLADRITKKLEPFTVVFLLPMFFTFSGLNTELGVMLDPSVLWVAIAVLLVSILGKGVACWAAARFNGEDNRTALAIGALMNSRGLMELIIINIGLQRGVIGQSLFAVLVVMAIVTTLITGPVFDRVCGRHLPVKSDPGH
ncbi:cation:proton antiporter [Luteolibacter algae]|uniref:Cation:proton antiporter n=1 Tax=Luteolibacter algae TaxID=454151 RepID=A0ABW5D6J8_9BACT